jgi:hypothetical protein
MEAKKHKQLLIASHFLIASGERADGLQKIGALKTTINSFGVCVE